jgi:hypothetical protein
MPEVKAKYIEVIDGNVKSRAQEQLENSRTDSAAENARKC